MKFILFFFVIDGMRERSWLLTASSIKKTKVFFNCGVVGYSFCSQSTSSLSYLPSIINLFLYLLILHFFNSFISFFWVGPRMKRDEVVGSFVFALRSKLAKQTQSPMNDKWVGDWLFARQRAAGGHNPQSFIQINFLFSFIKNKVNFNLLCVDGIKKYYNSIYR